MLDVRMKIVAGLGSVDEYIVFAKQVQMNFLQGMCLMNGIKNMGRSCL